jgi:acetyl-CoA carboxylase beta subunit
MIAGDAMSEDDNPLDFGPVRRSPKVQLKHGIKTKCHKCGKVMYVGELTDRDYCFDCMEV